MMFRRKSQDSAHLNAAVSPAVLASAVLMLVFCTADGVRAGDDVYRYWGKDGAAYTDDPQMIPADRKGSATVMKAPALPEGVTPLTPAEKAAALEEKRKKAAEARDAQRKKTGESYKRLLEQKRQAAGQEALQKARKAYDDEKAWLAAEEAALKKDLEALNAMKDEAGSLEKRKRNPRKGRQFREMEKNLEEASKRYDVRKAAFDARMKAFSEKRRP